MKSIIKFSIFYICLLPVFLQAQDDMRNQYHKAQDLLKNGHHLEALEELNQLLHSHPNFATGYAERAKVHMIIHRYGAAEADYNRAIELNSEYQNKHSNFAPLKALNESYKGFKYGYTKADIQTCQASSSIHVGEYNHLISSTFQDTLNILNKAFLKYTHGDIRGAENDLLIIFKSDSSNAYAHYLAGNIKEKKFKLKEALFHYSKAIDSDSTFYLFYFKKAVVLKKNHQYTAALHELNRAEKICQFNELIYYNRGVLNMRMKEWEMALSDLNKVIELNKNYSEAYFNRGFVKKHLSDFKGALQDYGTYASIKPLDHMLYNNRANIHLAIGNYHVALEDYNKAISIAPYFSDAYFNRGISKILIGNKESACIDFEKAEILGNEKGEKKQHLYCY